MSKGAQWFLEAIAKTVGGSVVIVAMMFITLPVDLGLSWLKMKVWNWFLVPYLHFPVMNVWLMFAIIVFVHTFRRHPRDLKEDLFSETRLHAFCWSILSDVIMFVTAFGIHHWVLKG